MKTDMLLKATLVVTDINVLVVIGIIILQCLTSEGTTTV